MAKPVVMATTLVTEDRVPIEAIHLPGPKDLAIVVAHGFTLSWQRPNVWRIANRLNQLAGVFSFDFRGHGRSGGLSTLGDREIADLDVVVRWARELGYQRVAVVGFSMGASIALRHAGLTGGVDAVVSVSGPGRWYYRGTESMRRVHFAVEHRIGRFVTRRWLKTRISPEGWKLVPVPPAEAAAQISPVPLLIVHGDKDHYFPPEHARQLYMAAREPKELWLMPGMGHAEAACGQGLTDRIGRWVRAAVADAGAAAASGDTASSPGEVASGHGASGHGASGHGASGHGASGHGASGHGASGHGASGHGASGSGASGHGAVAQAASAPTPNAAA